MLRNPESWFWLMVIALCLIWIGCIVEDWISEVRERRRVKKIVEAGEREGDTDVATR